MAGRGHEGSDAEDWRRARTIFFFIFCLMTSFCMLDMMD
jgi:hypothetical protein